MTNSLQNNAPDWTKGTFIWRLNTPDEQAIARSSEAIEQVQNLLDRTVKSTVIVSGLIGMDTGYQNWDGPWPYFNRASFRVNHDWNNIAKFMVDMRDRQGAWISFHTNITDMNTGLAYSEETRAFFEKLRQHKCYYTRDLVDCGGPYRGEAYIPDRIPVETLKMPYLKDVGDASDMFATVNYKNFWDSGLAREMLDEFFGHLPYPPPMLYVDVLSLTGNNCCVGFPDGELGGSAATQEEGRRKILDYMRSKGTVPGGEGPGDWTDYNWNHGGLSANDYSRIQSGYCQGNSTWRGIEPMHVYGNQGAYSVDIDGGLIAKNVAYKLSANGGTVMTGTQARTAEEVFSETDEWRTVPQVIDGFYLTVIQELYHIGRGNVRLPGGAGFAREDEHRGRVCLESYTLHDRAAGFTAQVRAIDGENSGEMKAVDHPWAATGKIMAGLENSLGCQNLVRFTVPISGTYSLIIRYYSVQGATADIYVNGKRAHELDFPATAFANYSGDLAVKVNLEKGENTIALRKGRIHTSWSDGTKAVWDHEGFRAWKGDVVFGIGYDRMWPDSWSGQKKIYFYSREGCSRSWQLPEEWRGLKRVVLYSLTGSGRGKGLELKVDQGRVAPELAPCTPYVVVQESSGGCSNSVPR